MHRRSAQFELHLLVRIVECDLESVVARHRSGEAPWVPFREALDGDRVLDRIE